MTSLAMPDRYSAIGTGMVAVHRIRLGRYRAVCACGRSSKHRLLKAAACQDAWAHAARFGCRLRRPLVLSTFSLPGQEPRRQAN
jgi:hypothetical protein